MSGEPNTSVRMVPASLADVRQLSRILNTIFARDPGTALVYSYPSIGTPGRNEAIARTLGLRTAMVRRLICNPNKHITLAKVGDAVAGFSIWTPPESEPSARRYIPLQLRVLGWLFAAYDRFVAILYPPLLQRVFDPATTERLRRRALMTQLDSEALKAAIPADIKARGYWTLSVLGVSEEYGRRGIGSKLLQWGFQEADKTDRAIVVSASIEGEMLYSRCGFELMDIVKIPKLGTEGGITQAYMIRLPASQRKAQ